MEDKDVSSSDENTLSIADIPVSGEVEVRTKPENPQSRIGTQEFADKISEMLSSGSVWKTSKFLAKEMGVDAQELDRWMRKQTAVTSRASKEDGVFLYAFVKRVESEKKEEKPPSRPLVSEEDRNAEVMLFSALYLMEGALRKYAVPISGRSLESYTLLIQAKEKLSAGVVLFAQNIKFDLKKLPDLPG